MKKTDREPDLPVPPTEQVKPNTPQKYGHARRVIPIRRRIWLKVLYLWLILLAIGGAFALLCAVSAPRFHYLRDFRVSISMTVLVYLFIIWQTHAVRKTVSREWTGRIIGREVTKYTKYGKAFAGHRPVMATKCIWTVEKDNGDIEKIHCDTDEIWERYFDIGERVRFYKNAKILVKAHPPKGDENLMCPLCGVMVMEPVCKKCGADFTEKEEG